MPYETTRQMLLAAQSERYAIPAFNVENIEMLRAVIEAAEQARSPVIVQAGVKTLAFMGFAAYTAAAVRALRGADIPAALHLDHCTDIKTALLAFREDFSSIMMDYSALPFEENIRLTKAAVQAFSADDVPVEGELGRVGGKEDDIVAEQLYTDPEMACRYAEETGITSLAVAIGTAHGVYASTPRLQMDLLKQIRQRVDVPLVLHGSSGLSDEAVRACIDNGMCKINFATELRQVYTDAIRRHLLEHPADFDLRSYEKPGVDAVRAICLRRIAVCGSGGRA